MRVWQDTITLPTYEEGPPDVNPPFDLFVTSRFNYPYTLRQNLSDRRVPRAWRALHLENEYLACTVLPDLGGHLYRCLDKLNGADLFYANPSIKFARIAYRGAWTALGIEFNFPVSHNWMTASPVDFATTTAKDGSASIWVGNIDRAYGMQWRVELTLRPGRAVLQQHTTLYNRSDTRHRFYWWTNAGVEVKDDSRILYPMRFTAAHGFADIDTWPVNSAGVDLSIVGNHTFGPVSRFAHGSREPFMAVYHPRTDSGVVHYSSPTDLPAKKIWSWGSDADGLDWRRALSDNNSAYVEVQAGLFRNQETYAFLEPQESIHFSEYWIPIRKIGGVSRANPDAVLNVSRPGGAGSRHVQIALNVTRAFPNATIAVLREGQVISKETVTLSPAKTFTREYALARLKPRPTAVGQGFSPANGEGDAPCTFVLRDAAGRAVLEHTENGYDYAPASEVKLGPQPAHRYPPADGRSEGDWLAIATQQELDGQLLVALDSYKEGLRRFPDSLQLNRAAGRLAVTLKQYEFADACLSKAVNRQTTDYESAYYLAVAALWRGDVVRARTLLETAQAYGTFRSSALFALAGLASRSGDSRLALDLVQRVATEQPDAVRVGCLEVALLRALKKPDQARQRLAYWLRRDPTSSFLRYEATRLGDKDEALWPHLAGDPERIIEIAADYIRFGLFGDGLDILSRQYPSAGVVSEPAMPRPDSYPLIAYYCAYCRRALGQNASRDLTAAAAMPTTYVFPNRADTWPVLKDAIAANASDAHAQFLLGSLYLSGGMTDRAMDAWETARRINPRIPVLHRNMGSTLLQTGGSLDRAVALLEEGTKFDRDNVGLYVALEQAMTRAGRPADERARAILSFPDQKALPTALVFRVATALAEAGRFDEAERQFEGRFFAREEGGMNVRQVYLEVRARRAAALAAQGRCADALDIVNRLTQPVAGLAFTRDGLEAFLTKGLVAELAAKTRAACGR